MKNNLELVVAVAENGVIGSENDLPFRLSSDLKRFKSLTMSKPIIMGRKTYQSIGRPLPGRTNIVITRQADFEADGVVIACSLKDALEIAAQSPGGDDAIMIIGGGEIYRQAMGYARRLHVTHVHARPDGDTHFPDIDPNIFETVEETLVPAGEKDEFASRYVIYERVMPSQS